MGVLSWLGLENEPEKEPVELNDANFNEIMRSSGAKPLLIDVWSDNCPHCHKLVPTIKKLAAKYENSVTVGHINTNRSPRSAARLSVRGTPTVVVFHRGSEYERVVGVRGQHFYEEILNEIISPSEGETEKDAGKKE